MALQYSSLSILSVSAQELPTAIQGERKEGVTWYGTLAMEIEGKGGLNQSVPKPCQNHHVAQPHQPTANHELVNGKPKLYTVFLQELKLWPGKDT
jgi:hypothetical protein